MIIDNYYEVEKNIKEAAKAIGRDEKDVMLLSVSKTKPDEDIMKLYKEGIRDFGENYVQELVGKIDRLPKDIRWHMIGHLQRNKVKYLVGKIALIHSVDSIRLAEEINERSLKEGLVTEILAQINIASEESKFGLSPEGDELEEFVRKVATMKGLKLTGLMTSAPYVADPEENRKYFSSMKGLLVDINEKNIDNVKMKKLSMGMTNDYRVAIEEGATIIRVGTAIFGARDYTR